jgi:deoxyadenosine/deoxycytidine kinase
MIVGSHLHIAVDGCTGVGKTTLARKLAEARKARLLLEDFEKNPFLSEFYSDPVAHALETELQFLLLHYHQLKSIRESTAGETISDFTFFKDLVFAETNLRDVGEKGVFMQLYEFLLKRLEPPDLVIYLKGSDDLIIERIRRRKRSIEQKVNVDYFKVLNRAYEGYFSHFRGQIHVIEADNFDFLNNPAALDEVCAEIDAIERPQSAAEQPSST